MSDGQLRTKLKMWVVPSCANTLHKDFCHFAKTAVITKDIDCIAYDVLRRNNNMIAFHCHLLLGC